MNMINVTLVGNLVKAPEQHSFASGRVKTTMRIAVSSPGRQKDDDTEPGADFYRVEVWGKLAELAAKYLQKGQQVGVSGRLIMEHWKDKEGRDRLTPVVAATQLQFPPRLGAKVPVETPQIDSRPSNVNEDESIDDAFRHEQARSELFADAQVVCVNEPSRSYTPFRPPERRRA